MSAEGIEIPHEHVGDRCYLRRPEDAAPGAPWSPSSRNGTFVCTRCERECCNCVGHAGDAAECCPLCDDCCVALGTPCVDDTLYGECAP